MNILIIYVANRSVKMRNTILESVLCYKDYKDVHFYHYNHCSRFSYLFNYMKTIDFDVIIFHYTLLAEMRWRTKKYYECILDCFKNSWENSIKVIMPQDEYYKTGLLRRFVSEVNIEIIYSLASKRDIEIFYPDTSNIKKYTILPGYVTTETKKRVLKIEQKRDLRKYDIGYRARNLNYTTGKHGNLKVALVDEVNSRLSGSGLVTNIKNTDEDKNVFWGDDWYRFLLDCKCVLGCNGGSSVMDIDGKIESSINQFLKRNPTASFDEVEREVLYEVEGNIQYKAITPRVFEAAMTKSCQILIRDDYGPLKAGIHYIELNEDYSNMNEVIEKVKDEEYCRKIANNAYQLLVASGDYSYNRFVIKVVNSLKKKMRENNKKETTKEYRLVKLLLRVHELVLFLYYKMNA